MDIAERRKRALGWIAEIRIEILDLLTDWFIFWEVQKIIDANKELAQARSHFFLFLASGYVASAASAVRRQVDPDTQNAISLRRLIEELATYPDLVTREYFVGLYDPEDFHQELANNTFAGFADSSGEKLDASQLTNDASLLKTKADIVKHYVDRRIAHYDKRGIRKIPTLGDLDDSIDTCKQLGEKYILILTAVSENLQSTITYDWKAPFRIKWIS